MAYMAMACMVMANKVTAYIDSAHVFIACVVTTMLHYMLRHRSRARGAESSSYIVMVYIVIACIVMSL